MSGCVKCGYSPDAVVTKSWTFVVAREVKSLNARGVNVRGWRGGVYKRDRDNWQWAMKAERINWLIPIAVGRRRLTLTRLFAGRQREFDRDNLSGMKVVVDAMVREGLLTGDSTAHAEIHFAQERAATAGLRVLLEELA